jgi:hypothetical protein
MANEPIGVKRAINAAWDRLPEILIASVVALAFFGFGLWVDTRDIKRNLESVIEEQATDRLCQRIGACTGASGGASISIYELRSAVIAMKEKLDERGMRIVRLEQQVDELLNKPLSRPDPFTGTMGRLLEERVRDLEEMKP